MGWLQAGAVLHYAPLSLYEMPGVLYRGSPLQIPRHTDNKDLLHKIIPSSGYPPSMDGRMIAHGIVRMPDCHTPLLSDRPVYRNVPSVQLETFHLVGYAYL